MEDAATAEISRAQLWQWVHHGAKLADGPAAASPPHSSRNHRRRTRRHTTKVDAARFNAYERAADLMRKLIESPTFPEFLTVPAYAASSTARYTPPERVVEPIATPCYASAHEAAPQFLVPTLCWTP